MPIPNPSTKERAFISASLLQTRLVNERVISAPAAPSKDPVQIQLRIDTSSGFSISLDDVEKPAHVLIEVDYKVNLKTLDTDKQFVEYEAKHATHFSIAGWSGFDSWPNIPNDALVPYLAMTQSIAIRRAESTLLDMGVRGVSLPTPSVDKPEMVTKVEVAAPTNNQA